MGFLRPSPYVMQTSWSTRLQANQVLKSLGDTARRDGARVDQLAADRLLIHYGSRLSLRFWGAMHPDRASVAPAILDVRSETGASGDTLITVVAQSDEGWSLYRGKAFRRFYEELLTKKIDQLKTVGQ